MVPLQEKAFHLEMTGKGGNFAHYYFWTATDSCLLGYRLELNEPMEIHWEMMTEQQTSFQK